MLTVPGQTIPLLADWILHNCLLRRVDSIQTHHRNIFQIISRSLLIGVLGILSGRGIICPAQDKDTTADFTASATVTESKIFICIYADQLESAADEWVAYRKQTGWQAEAIAISEIVDPEAVQAIRVLPKAWHQSGFDPATSQSALQLSGYLQERFRLAQQVSKVKGGYFAVLLLGDVNVPREHVPDWSVIPTFYFDKPADRFFRVWHEADNYATDHPFQLADFKDQLPDFTLGRVPAQTNDAARIVLHRIKEYEGNPAPGPWRKRINYIASEGRFGIVDRLIESLFIKMVETVVPYDFDITMTYANPTSPYCAPPSQFNSYVMRRFNEGALLVNYLGHGAPHQLDVLAWRGEYYPICHQDQAARQLDIDPTRAPILLIIACSTGMYDLPFGNPALAESMLFHPRGPIAVVSGSRITHPYPNSIFQNAFTAQLCGEQRPTIGGVDLMAARHLIQLKGAGNRQAESLANIMALQDGWETSPAELRLLHASLYNLLGDPATLIPYPSAEKISVLTFAQDTGTGTGALEDVSDAEALRIVATLEVPRAMIARSADLRRISGRNDAELEAKAAHNYEIANNFVLTTITTTPDSQGNFRFTFAEWSNLTLPPGTKQLWLKIAVYRQQTEAAPGQADPSAETGALEALGSLQINLP